MSRAGPVRSWRLDSLLFVLVAMAKVGGGDTTVAVVSTPVVAMVVAPALDVAA